MPMPPPKPSTEGPRDRRVSHEMGQLVQTLRASGPLSPSELAHLVGAENWKRNRFDRAVAFMLADGLAVRTSDGKLRIG